MGDERSHDTLREVLAATPPCKILDAACGEGALARHLDDLGFDVHCGDILPELFKAEGLPVRAVNLNRPLPYEDGEFDAVVCANAIHRLFNPAGAIREFHRILRPGGRLFLNMNNYASIETRIRFLVFGSIERREWKRDSIRSGIRKRTCASASCIPRSPSISRPRACASSTCGPRPLCSSDAGWLRWPHS